VPTTFFWYISGQRYLGENGGVSAGQANGEDRFWITVDGESPLP
jgi:hypothetical protein